MKSSYELAMERLNRASPTVKLKEGQKQRIAELEAEYKAKLADREIFLGGKLEKAIDKGDPEEVSQIEKQLVSDRKTFQSELEAKKEQIRLEA